MERRSALAILLLVVLPLLASSAAAVRFRSPFAAFAARQTQGDPIPDNVDVEEVDTAGIETPPSQYDSALPEEDDPLDGFPIPDGTVGAVGGPATIDLLVPPEVLRLNLSPKQRLLLARLPSLLPSLKTTCACDPDRRACYCCTTVAVGSSRHNQTGCLSLAYVRERFAVTVKATFNNRTLLERDIISGGNPPPFCFPLPQAPIINICLRLSNITFTNDAKMQVCAAVEAGLTFTAPLIRARFGCVVAGPGGASWSTEPLASAVSIDALGGLDSQPGASAWPNGANNTSPSPSSSGTSGAEQFLQSLIRQRVQG